MYHKNKILLAFVIVLVFFLYVLNIREIDIFSYFRNKKKVYTTNLYVINTKGCRIPDLEINAEEILQHLSKVGAYQCSRLPPLVTSNLTSLTVNEEVFRKYKIKSHAEVNCSYQPFWRVDPVDKEPDHKVKYGKKTYFQRSVNVDEEFVKIECKYHRKTYKDFQSFVPIRDVKQSAINNNKFNIIIFGTDSLSRLHFHRTMPKTSRFLLEELNAIELFGYNKLSDNTFPNLIPLLTGYSFEELIKVCWPNYDTHFDNCSFVYQNYSKSGYTTAFSEECTEYGLYNYLKKGWYKQPTDYYWKTFDYTSMSALKHNYDLYNTYPDCMGPNPMFRNLLEYHQKFITRMLETNQRFFSFLWVTTLAHNNFNTAVLGENDYIKHLSFLIDSGILNSTILLFLSDHGYRFGAIPRTYQGHLEERLPYVFFVLPAWFYERYPMAYDNLKENSRRLTTPFDIFATLNHILDPEKLTEEFLSEEVKNERSISLFKKVPLERTCESTDIPSHWCTCHESLPVSKDDPIVLSIGLYVTDYMNYLLRNYGNCSVLHLDTITNAKLAKYGSGSLKIQDYTVSFKVLPGGGWFDATVRCTHCNSLDYQISGTVSRLNRYDNTSFCIDDFNLKLYCYCKHQLQPP